MKYKAAQQWTAQWCIRLERWRISSSFRGCPVDGAGGTLQRDLGVCPPSCTLHPSTIQRVGHDASHLDLLETRISHSSTAFQWGYESQLLLLARPPKAVHQVLSAAASRDEYQFESRLRMGRRGGGTGSAVLGRGCQENIPPAPWGATPRKAGSFAKYKWGCVRGFTWLVIRVCCSRQPRLKLICFSF